jgi:3-oxoadipate enol-lactonase
MSIGAWDSFVPALAPTRRVIRCDFRGQLLTPGPYAESFQDHVADVVALLDFLEIARVDVAGASFGGEVAMLLSATASDRVDRLTVITATDYADARMRDDAREARERAELAAAGDKQAAEMMFTRVLTETWSSGWLAKQPADFIESRAKQLSMLPPAYFTGGASLLRILETLDLRDQLPRIKARTLVIGAAEDRVFPVEHSRAIAAAIPDAELKIVPDTGHGLLFERADVVIDAIR